MEPFGSWQTRVEQGSLTLTLTKSGLLQIHCKSIIRSDGEKCIWHEIMNCFELTLFFKPLLLVNCYSIMAKNVRKSKASAFMF